LGVRNKDNKLVPFQLTEDLKPDVPGNLLGLYKPFLVIPSDLSIKD